MKETYVLQQADFDALLGLFSAKQEEAGEKYEQVRRGLIRYFHFRGCSNSEDLADETLNRVATKATDFDPAKNVQPVTYVYGFASKVLLEYKRTGKRAESLDAPGRPIAATDIDDDADVKEAHHACLSKCLAEIDTGERKLFVEYFSLERQERIELRKAIAERLNCRPATLHTRISRVMSVLRGCVNDCLKKSL